MRRLGLTALIAILLVSILAPLFTRSSVAYADPTNNNFTFYVPPANLAQLKTSIDNNNNTDASLAATEIYVTGGFFGSHWVTMSIEPNESGCAQGSGVANPYNNCQQIPVGNSVGNFGGGNSGNGALFVYEGHYACDLSQKNADLHQPVYDATTGSSNSNDHYDVTFDVALSLGYVQAGNVGLFNQDNSLHSPVVMHWAGFTNIAHWAQSSNGVARTNTQVPSSNLLNSHCTPPFNNTSVYHNASNNGTDQSGLDGGIVNENVAVKQAPPAGAPAPSSSTSAGGAPQTGNTPTCESSDAFTLNWAVCPVITGIADGAEKLYSYFIQPLLDYKPVDLTAGQQTYQVWSQFRIYADIFLVIALLIIVYSEAAGGGLIDTYSAKKVLPRLLAAAILINLSIYIVAFGVDVFNILGNGLTNLLEEPFKSVHGFSLNFAAGFNYLLAFGTAAGGVSVWALSHYGGAKLVGPILKFIIFSIIIPALFILLAITAVVIVRRGLILLLVMVSPVAFVLYTLPNTEQYFRRWWDLLMRTLLVYPIISVAFAMGNILAVTMNNAVSGLDKVVADIIATIALFAPLAFIPFSFQIAGGILGRAYEGINRATRGIDKAMFDQRREIAKRDVSERSLQGRGSIYRRMLAASSSHGPPDQSAARGTIRAMRNRALRSSAGIIGGYNVMAAESAAQAQTTKEIEDTIASGDDSEIRALTVDKRHALALGKNKGWRETADGRRQFKTLGGKWVDEAYVDAAQARWGNNAFAVQSALSYEMRKTDSKDDITFLKDNYKAVAEGHGLNEGQRGGAWIGSAFANQNQNLEYKYVNPETGKIDEEEKKKAFLSEMVEKRGSYNLAQMHASTIDQIREINREAQARLASSNGTDADAQIMARDSARIAEAFVSRYGAGGTQIGAAGDQGDIPLTQPNAPAGAQRGVVQTITPGAEHTAESVRQLAIETGRYRDLPDDKTRVGPSPPGVPRGN